MVRVNQKSKNIYTSKSGYTLIELSVSITIIAVLLTGGMTVLSKQNEIDKRNETIQKINRIERALQYYVDFNGHLPCPAVGNSLTSDAAFGISSAYDGNTLNCTEVAGMVPVRTLNLNDEEAFDSWNWKFTYRIASGMGSADSYVDPNFIGDLKIINLSGNEKTSTTSPEGRNFGAAYVLMSHGPNGAGAWPRNASITPVSPTGMELENFNHVVNNTYIQDQTTAQYDDITAYKTPSQISPPRISEAPIVLNADICSNADAIVDDGPPRTGSNSNALGDFIALDQSNNAPLAEQYYKSAIQVKFLCDNPPLSFKFPTPWPAILLLEDINNGDGSEGFSLYGSASNREIGDAVSEIGDINNDGTVDFAIASSKDTSDAYVHIIFGTDDLWPEESNITTYSISDGTKGVRLTGSSDGTYAIGDFIASLGDVNDDNIDDFFISSPSEGTRYAGGYVIYGRSTAWPSSINLENIADGSRTGGFRMRFADVNQEIVSVGGNADINGDGINDMVIGSSAEGANDEGSVFVIFGSNTLPTTNTVDLASSPPDGFIEIETTIFNEHIGSSVALGDVNNNGFADIIIGATGIQTAALERTGGVYVVFGETISALNTSPPGSFDVGNIVPGSNGVKFTADNGQGAFMDGARAGTSISSLDLNRDGFDDILIGAPRAYNVDTSSQTGEAYLLFGSSNFGGVLSRTILATDLNGILGTTFRGFETDELAGTSVAIVEDVNGDSIRDILIGAPGKEIALDEVGVVYLFFGRSAAYSWNNMIDLEDIRNSDGSIGTEIRGTDNNDLTGTFVAAAGDIDKDGFNDIIIGSPGADRGLENENGRTHIIYGH